MTYRFAAYSIQTALKQNFDDALISIPHIIYWISLVANKYAAKDIEKGKRSGGYLSIFKNVTVYKDNYLDQHYIDLPAGVLCLDYDAGVEFITYNRKTCCCEGPAYAQVNFSWTTPGQLINNFGDEWEKPSTTNPYFYQVGQNVDGVNVDRLYFVGTECIHLRDVMMGLYTGVNPAEVCDLDEAIPLKSKYHDTLIREVISLGRFMILVPEDLVNEGADEVQEPPVQVPNAVKYEQTQQQQQQFDQ
jgi:hypothetical protein